jgi:hypothetical protein
VASAQIVDTRYGWLAIRQFATELPAIAPIEEDERRQMTAPVLTARSAVIGDT